MSKSKVKSIKPSVLGPRAGPGAAALLQAAEQLAQAGRLDEATGMLNKALAANPASAPAHNLMAILALMRNDSAAARVHAQAAQAHGHSRSHTRHTHSTHAARDSRAA